MRRKRPKSSPARPAELEQDPHTAVFTVDELAARWRTSRNTVVAAIHAGKLLAFKPDKRVWRISQAEVLRYEQQGSAVAS